MQFDAADDILLLHHSGSIQDVCAASDHLSWIGIDAAGM